MWTVWTIHSGKRIGGDCEVLTGQLCCFLNVTDSHLLLDLLMLAVKKSRTASNPSHL